MKIKVRTGIFETNSSSVHTLCICKEKDPPMPKNVKLSFEYTDTRTFEGKLNYIYKMCADYDMEYPQIYPDYDKTYIYKLVEFLENRGFVVEFDREHGYYFDSCYDTDVLDAFLSSEDSGKLLEDFLYNSKSFVTIRDNNYASNPLPEEIADKDFKEHYIRFDIYD